MSALVSPFNHFALRSLSLPASGRRLNAQRFARAARQHSWVGLRILAGSVGCPSPGGGPRAVPHSNASTRGSPWCNRLQGSRWHPATRLPTLRPCYGSFQSRDGIVKAEMGEERGYLVPYDGTESFAS
jgi:hypothetical protein